MVPMQVIRHTSAIASALSLAAVIGVSGAYAQSSPAPRDVLTSWASEKGLPPSDVFAMTQPMGRAEGLDGFEVFSLHEDPNEQGTTIEATVPRMKE
jgi:hypothetical protein